MLLQCTFIGGLLSVVDLAELVIHAVKAVGHLFFHTVQLVTKIVVFPVRAVRVNRLIFHRRQIVILFIEFGFQIEHESRDRADQRDNQSNQRSFHLIRRQYFD